MNDLERLRDRYRAGEFDASGDVEDTPPFMQRRCRDCPFWRDSICNVRAEYRPPFAPTCRYIEEENHEAGQRVIDRRPWQQVNFER